MNSKSQQQSNGCGCLLRLIGYGIIIPTILSLILPSLLDCSKKPKESEAKQYVSSMNRAQQAYFVDNNTFANNFQKLGLGIKTEMTNYRYSISATNKAVFSYGITRSDAYQTEYILFIPRRVNVKLKSYIGGVFIVPATEVDANAVKDEIRTIAILCQTNSPSTTKPAKPTYKNGVLACGEGTRDLSR
ncbi:MAG TPA: general secretion pathway protein GspH [Cyanobacteria bacterium UBA11149]|nr:general secretion pathway protein GspH [Cyanobacteria bacterium UBA11367]HBE57622.1 general secretion pathway protein GspH [Cyanobacteria bacterium UBA11366]HBK62147.1 general secretion pathway protein GspH [Cyanobacteria bacterium UBA11166]HBR73165.1 general secretion pathway protein GspH [Cyanobacteria bacterium UBA11159]HBS69561.1 general secretion pathway protein GspH [Cyanobacteria bacterium UBA11153]HBW88053.1 general secretion pathway protein GspH [Cyanobacteria bacterium UBA11149]H